MRAYAGIGSRETPEQILVLMRAVGRLLAIKGWTLRSGGAEGADVAFEQGAWDALMTRPTHPKPEIYLPWPSFNKGKRVMILDRYYVSEPQPEAFEIARRFHPAWDRLSSGGRALHARNVHQVLGRDVTKPEPSRFIVCWTKGGAGAGGTGQALRIAKGYDVPVFDLALEADRERVEQFVY